MRSFLIIFLFWITLLSIFVPVYILHNQMKKMYEKQIFDSNMSAISYHCMLDATKLKVKLDIDLELSKQRYKQMSKQVNTSLQREENAQFVPHDCVASETTAIIIPIRDRDEHLQILLGHLHPILQKQFIR